MLRLIDVLGLNRYLRTGDGQELARTMRSWNNLVVPENDSTTAGAACAWTAHRKFGALRFASYPGPKIEWTHCTETYGIMEEMAPLLLTNKGAGEMLGFHQEVEKTGESWEYLFLGGLIHLTATNSVDPAGERNNITGGEVPGCGLIARSSADEFILVGSRVDLEWRPPAGKKIHLKFAEEGRFENGRWQKLRPARVEAKEDSLLFHFPHENAAFLQIRCGVGLE